MSGAILTPLFLKWITGVFDTSWDGLLAEEITQI